ncbi:MAG: hypothetical protein R3Y62_02820 [Eubacteriales bacterium]
MKIARFVLKIVGGSLVLAGAACLVIGYWDKLLGGCRKAYHLPSEYDDYADI